MPIKGLEATLTEAKALLALPKSSLFEQKRIKAWQKDRSCLYEVKPHSTDEETEANKCNLPDSVLLTTMHRCFSKG